MYQVLFPEGQLECAHYERNDHGVDLFDEGKSFIAFIPYPSLHAIIDEERFADDEPEPSVV